MISIAFVLGQIRGYRSFSTGFRRAFVPLQITAREGG